MLGRHAFGWGSKFGAAGTPTRTTGADRRRRIAIVRSGDGTSSCDRRFRGRPEGVSIEDYWCPSDQPPFTSKPTASTGTCQPSIRGTSHGTPGSTTAPTPASCTLPAPGGAATGLVVRPAVNASNLETTKVASPQLSIHAANGAASWSIPRRPRMAHLGLRTPPWRGGWVQADDLGGFTCCVSQAHYCHEARKMTWLYVFGITYHELPALQWGAPRGLLRLETGCRSKAHRVEYMRNRANNGAAQNRLPHKAHARTPVPFRDLLIEIARQCDPSRAAPIQGCLL